MADIGQNIKGIWMKGMEAIGNAASNIATNTKSKVDEMNLVNRRAEILKDFGNQAYALWQKGEQFPEVLSAQLEELKKLDEQLNDLRAERLAGVKTGSPAEAKEAVEEVSDIAAEIIEETAATADPDAYETTMEIVEEDENADEADSVPVIRVEDTGSEEKETSGLSSAINDLFDQVPSAEEAAEKVNSALDSLEDNLKKFSDSMDEKIDELSDKIGIETKDE